MRSGGPRLGNPRASPPPSRVPAPRPRSSRGHSTAARPAARGGRPRTHGRTRRVRGSCARAAAPARTRLRRRGRPRRTPRAPAGSTRQPQQVATVMLDVADREQRVPNAAAVRRVALSSFERARCRRGGNVEITEVDPEMAEVGEERLDGPLVAELLAELERLLLQPHRALEVRAHARELARGDAALRLDGERRAARQRQRLLAPRVRLLVPSTDQPVEPCGTDDAKR